jgi:hypothetical protein
MSPGTSTVVVFPLTFNVKGMALTLSKVREIASEHYPREY